MVLQSRCLEGDRSPLFYAACRLWARCDLGDEPDAAGPALGRLRNKHEVGLVLVKDLELDGRDAACAGIRRGRGVGEPPEPCARWMTWNVPVNPYDCSVYWTTISGFR